MPTVRNIILKSNLKPIPFVDDNSTVLEALVEMARLNTGALLVKSQDSISGVFSERDYARKVALNSKDSSNSRVGEIMTKEIVYVEMKNSLDECMSIMTDKNIRHLLVLSNGVLKGFISMNDVISCIVDAKDFHISQLTQYITGSRTEVNLSWCSN